MSLEYHQHSHLHVTNEELHKLLHSKKYVRNLDRWVLLVGILGPVMTLPQVWQIWATQDAEGLSLLTWSSWLIFTLFWFAYGLAHRSKPIIINNLLWLFIHTSVIIGILLYQ